MSHIRMNKYMDRPSVSRIHQDGLLDIFLALGISFAVIAIATDLIWLAGILAASLIPLWAATRQAIITSRRGGKSPNVKQIGRSRMVFVALTILGVLTLVIGLALYWLIATGSSPAGLRAWLSENFLTVGWIFGAFLLSLVALLAGITRFYFYALLALLAGIWGPLPDLPPIMYVVGLAALMLLVGLSTLIRFLRTNPA